MSVSTSVPGSVPLIISAYRRVPTGEALQQAVPRLRRIELWPIALGSIDRQRPIQAPVADRRGEDLDAGSRGQEAGMCIGMVQPLDDAPDRADAEIARRLISVEAGTTVERSPSAPTNRSRACCSHRQIPRSPLPGLTRSRPGAHSHAGTCRWPIAAESRGDRRAESRPSARHFST